MPVYAGTTGGLNIQPNIIREPVDPLERALKLAQLYNLQNEPRVQDRQLTQQANRDETSKNLGFAQLSLEQKKAEVAKFLADNNVKHDSAALAEANRHNVATETQSTDQLAASKQTQIFGDLSRMQVDPEARTKLLADYMAENGDISLKTVLLRNEANKPKPQGEYGATTNPTATPLGIPNAYVNDPAFSALAPLLAKKQADDLAKAQYGWGERLGATVTGRTPEEQRRNNALRQLKSKAGIYKPGIDPLYLGY